jgi:structure-specific endonuclease subunit SLX1
MASAFFVYLLECSDGSTYVGATVDPDHRLRQHRGELTGGARATTIKIKQGHDWSRVLCVAGFPTWQSALQFEWAFKYYSRKYLKIKNPLERRMRGLYDILHMDKPTSNAMLYSEWPNETRPQLLWEDKGCISKIIYDNLEK